MPGFRELFQHPSWQDFRAALHERRSQIVHELEAWRPEGGDAGTNLADLMTRLREMATLRWVADVVPDLLTESEGRAQLDSEVDTGEGDAQPPKTAGQAEYAGEAEEG